MKLFALYLLFFLKSINASFDSNQPLLVKADSAVWNQKTKELILQGKVCVTQKNKFGNNRILYANKLIYNQSLDKIIATDQVKFIEADGTVITSESLDLDSHFNKGSLSGINLLSPDFARLSAKKANRKEGKNTSFEMVEYSPCKLCQDGSVTWKLEAEEVDHDEQAKLVKYRNVFLTFKGYKVFYMPYLSYPDPSVKNKSGFLMPAIGVGGSLGAYAATPYVFTNGNQDLTITPMLSTKENPLIATEYRKRFLYGEMNLGGSYTSSKNDKVKLYSKIPKKNRWNVSSYVSWHITEKNKMLIDLNRASDTTYLTKYRLNKQSSAFDRKKNLTSTVNFEHFGNQSYFVSQAQSFQTDTPATTPLILPHVQHRFYSENFDNGSHFEWNSSFLSVMRKKPVITQIGKQTYRGSSGLAWIMPFTTENGQVITTNLSTRADAYICRDYVPIASEKITEYNDKVSTRFFPQASVDWRYPLLSNNANWVLEPRSLLAVAPQKLNRKRMPNEDSRLFTLDDTSIFLPNRFDGIDKVDEGSRFVYGADNHINFASSQKSSIFFGQSHRLDKKSVAGISQGEGKKASDYITRLLYSPNKWATLFARSALLQKSLKSRYSEIGSCLGQEKLSLDVAYTHAKRGLNNSTTMVSQVSWQLSSKFKENWECSVSQIRNLHRFKKGVLATFANISYEDDCFKSRLSLYRSHYQDRDIKPDTGFMLQFSFKNIGTFTPASTTTYPGSILNRIK